MLDLCPLSFHFLILDTRETKDKKILTHWATATGYNGWWSLQGMPGGSP